MKFSEAWLREWVDPKLSSQELGERLSMVGLELDGITPAAPILDGVIVAVIEEIVPHPNAEWLSVCTVNTGQERLQVVCGAPNAHKDMRAPFAPIGTVLPDGVKIKRAKLRDVESFGMLCSAKELGIAESAVGLLSLNGDAVAGTPIRKQLQLDDHVFEIDLTPNRADCLSIAGIAREVAACTGASLTPLSVINVKNSILDVLSVVLGAAEACPRYVGRIIRGIEPRNATPLWMQERLRRSGVRSISPVVDVTNYVMLELGQPMHAFDLAKIQGGIRVRFAQDKESLHTLDGQVVDLNARTLVIADHDKPIAMAGIMGGLATAVGEQTTDIFLESAFFDPAIIIGRGREYGLHTDSSHRFERGVDPLLQARALERATQLLLEIVGGQAGPVIDVSNEESLPKSMVIVLRAARIKRLLGIEVAAPVVTGMLERLGCEVKQLTDGWRVVPPSFRFDLAIENDLIEEIARLYGYDKIPGTHRNDQSRIHLRQEQQVPIERLCGLLLDRGYNEAITFSFIDDELDGLFSSSSGESIRLANPISSELAVMRRSLWPGLIQAVKYNLNRQQPRVKLFETGLRFVMSDDGLQQIPTLAGITTGSVLPEQWGVIDREIDFFDIKGDAEALLDLCGSEESFEFQGLAHSVLHPGQAASVFHKDTRIGSLGALHPRIQNKLELEQDIFLLEFDLEFLLKGQVPRFQTLSRFPAIRRDISILVDASITAAQVRKCISDENIKYLRNIVLFDVYTGKKLPNGRKSLALGLILQDLSSTLNDKDVDQMVSGIITALHNNLGASLRG